MKEIPLFGSGVFGKSATVTDQRRVNVYYEMREDNEKARIGVFGTRGQALFVSLPAIVRGWTVFNILIIAVAGNSVYSISNVGVVTTLGTIVTSAGMVLLA